MKATKAFFSAELFQTFELVDKNTKCVTTQMKATKVFYDVILSKTFESIYKPLKEISTAYYPVYVSTV